MMRMQALAVVAVLAVSSLNAQQAEAAKETGAARQENTTEAKQERSNPTQKLEALRFQYTLAELNGKQKINARTFEILTTHRGEMKSRSRMPVAMGASVQYLEVGLSADMDFTTRAEEEIALRIGVDMDSAVPPDSEGSDAAAKKVSPEPIVRQTHIQADTEVKLGVPTVIARVEDVASAHSYELSVTVTRR